MHIYRSPGGCSAVYLPFDLSEIVEDWSRLRVIMARQIPDAFTRDEWAYLITFLDRANLCRPFEQSFGEPVEIETEGIVRVIRRRGNIGIWLPGNVSLLGPLTMILLSLTGNRIRMKGATGAEDLTGEFLEFARSHIPNGALLTYLENDVRHEVFERDDVRNQEMAQEADVRIAFGSDQAVTSILNLDHPLGSTGIAFADRQSEAWIEKDAISDALLSDLIKVFAIYGQAGCTSPRRAVILGATSMEVTAIRDSVQAMWPEVIRGVPAPHVASENIMSRQCAAARGWDATLAPRNAAVLASGTTALEAIPGQMALAFVPADIDEAIETLPDQIQTIGYGVAGSRLGAGWLDVLGRTGIERLVPIGKMHHFGPVWDGQAFWRQAFDEVEVAQ
jgi:hypothetical protein